MRRGHDRGPAAFMSGVMPPLTHRDVARRIGGEVLVTPPELAAGGNVKPKGFREATDPVPARPA
jgi:hypothetical protein